VFMTYLGAPRSIRRQDGRRVAEGWARPGTVTLIPADSAARWDIDGTLDALHIYLPPDSLASVCEGAGRPRCDLAERTAARDEWGSQLLKLMVMESASSLAKPDRLFLGHAADLLCLHLAGVHPADDNAPERRGGGLAPWQVKRVCAFMLDHLAQDISLNDLAAHVGLSTFHFCRAFKQAVGLSPHQWRRMQRVRRACDLLETTQIAVTEIAAAVGYDDPSQLAKVFNRVMGTTPSRYRLERS
jgi:AraC family transcriptional regulator